MIVMLVLFFGCHNDLFLVFVQMWNLECNHFQVGRETQWTLMLNWVWMVQKIQFPALHHVIVFIQQLGHVLNIRCCRCGKAKANVYLELLVRISN